jgi:hypothetical protein
MTYDVRKLIAFDLETHKISAGNLAPPIVCGSEASIGEDGNTAARLLPDAASALAFARQVLDSDRVMVGHNVIFDLGCLAAADGTLLPLIWKAFSEGRIYDTMIAHCLDAIAGGHLGMDPRTGGDLRDPSTGKTSKRYSLATLTDLVCGRKDAKAHDTWRTSYALLEGVPAQAWPREAADYPVDDAVNTLEVAARQVTGWDRGAFDPERGPCRNLENLPAQVEAAFALHLGACWGLRTNGAKVEALSESVEKKHAETVKVYQGYGWVRQDGTKDQAAVKRRIAEAYGAGFAAPCPKCGGKGRLRPLKAEPCRGEKVKGRYAGCLGTSLCACQGSGKVEKEGSEVVCSVELDAEAKHVAGCDGTGYDLRDLPFLPRTDKGGVATDRDALMESADDALSAYGENETEKVRTTYLPWLRRGVSGPVNLRPNVLVATGRCSYEDPLHQMPRDGGVRETIYAREGFVFASTDYEAGELCTFSQYMYWVLGHSSMMEAINETGKPGILHSVLAAEVLGLPLEEFLQRLAAGDKQAKLFRQASKPVNFGVPGGMGVSKQVMTNRKKNAGSTTLPDGRMVAGIRFCVLVGGARECGIEKIVEWKGRPTAPVCKACCDIVESVLRPSYFKRFPEVKEYFKWVSDTMESNDNRMPCLAWNEDKGEAEIIRWRGGCDYSSACNNGFQAMLADIGKLAFATLARESYLGAKADGSPSPLHGSRPIVFMHDEPLCELPTATAHLAGPRIAEVMMWAGKKLAPDVTWRAETALCGYLTKGMEPVYVDGKLVPWTPKGGK